LDDEGWITDIAFLVDVTGHLNNLNKELHGKDKLITDMYNNIKAFRVKLRLWENHLKLRNLVHFPHLKTLDTIFPERIQKYSKSFFSRRVRRTIPGLQNYGNRIFVVCLTLKGRRRECSRKSANGINQFTVRLLNLPSFLKQICKIFIPTCQKKIFLCLDPLG
jgi:hypothetical protein